MLLGLSCRVLGERGIQVFFSGVGPQGPVELGTEVEKSNSRLKFTQKMYRVRVRVGAGVSHPDGLD